MKYFLLSISTLLIGVIFICHGCANAQPKYHPGGPYYYKSWASYILPLRPTGEISYQEAKQMEVSGYSYYEAYFNDDGYIKEFKKYIHGQIVSTVIYFYENGVLVRSEEINREGKKTILLFGKNGKIIKP